MKTTKPRGSAVIILIVIVAVLIIGGGLFFVLNSKKTATAPNSTATTPANSENSTGSTVITNQVNIKDMAFTPDSITVAKGTKVTWVNNDGAAHTVTADDGSFNSGNLTNSKSFSQTFNTPGTYKYHCTLHSGMTGVVIVTP